MTKEGGICLVELLLSKAECFMETTGVLCVALKGLATDFTHDVILSNHTQVDYNSCRIVSGFGGKFKTCLH